MQQEPLVRDQDWLQQMDAAYREVILAALRTAPATGVIYAPALRDCTTRRAQVFAAAAALAPGDSFLLVNDHDPIGLYAPLCATYGVAWNWIYEAAGSVYVVRVGRPA